MKEEPTPPTISTARRPEPDQPREAQRGPRTAAALKPLVPGMRRLLFTAAVLIVGGVGSSFIAAHLAWAGVAVVSSR